MSKLRATLRRLEFLRHTDPEECLRAAKSAAQQALPEDCPWLLGEWATALRVLGRIEDARGVLQTARKVAERVCSGREIQADLLQRRASIEAYSGRFPLALAISEKALLIHTMMFNKRGIGRALTDRGAFFIHLNEFELANDCFASALLYLEKKDHLTRFACLMNSAYSYQRLANLEERRRCIQQAKALDKVPEGMIRQMQWAEAELCLADGRVETAAQIFEALIKYFWEANQIPQAALATTMIVDCYLKSGQLEKAKAIAKTMTRFIIPLSGDRPTAAAVTNLIRSAMGVDSKLNDNVLAQVITELTTAIRASTPSRKG